MPAAWEWEAFGCPQILPSAHSCGGHLSLPLLPRDSSPPPTDLDPLPTPTWNWQRRSLRLTSFYNNEIVPNSPFRPSPTTSQPVPGCAKGQKRHMDLPPTSSVYTPFYNVTTAVGQPSIMFQALPMPWRTMRPAYGISLTMLYFPILTSITHRTNLGPFALCGPRWIPV